MGRFDYMSWECRMGDTAQAEAERIVRGVEDEAPCRWCNASRESRDRLVAALSAAIKVERARMDKHAQKTQPVEEAMQRNIEAHEELERALSALRQTVVEPALENIRDADRDWIKRTTTRPTREADISDLEEE